MATKRTPVLVASGVILLLTLGVTPKIVGLNLRESTTDNLFALIPPETLRQLEISESTFESGWFGSTAVFDVTYSPLGLNEEFSMNLAFEFSHGPLMWTSNGVAVGLAHATIIPTFNSAEITEAIASIPFELPEIKLNLLAGFDQSLSIALAIAGVDIEESDTTVNFGGLAGNLRAHADQSAEFALNIGELNTKQESTGIGFNLGGLELFSETDQMNDLLAPSRAELNIPSFSSDGLLPFTASDITANSVLNDSVAGEELINIQQQFAIANLSSELPLSALRWTTEINDLSTTLIQSYYELLVSLQEQMQGQAGGATGGSTSVEELSEQLTLVLLRNPLSFDNYIDATAYEGDHSLEVLANWQGIPQLNAVDAISIEAILAALELRINMSLDLAAITNSPLSELIDPYVQQGYIQLNNGRIVLELSLIDSELVVNGSSTSLDQFFPSQNL